MLCLGLFGLWMLSQQSAPVQTAQPAPTQTTSAIEARTATREDQINWPHLCALAGDAARSVDAQRRSGMSRNTAQVLLTSTMQQAPVPGDKVHDVITFILDAVYERSFYHDTPSEAATATLEHCLIFHPGR